MDETNKNINVEKIMEEIREQIRKEEGMADIPTFEDIPMRGEEASAAIEPVMNTAEAEEEKDWPLLIRSLHYLNNNYDIPYYWSFGPRSLKTFAKRVVRKLLKCLVAPILVMQNGFNANVVRCLNQLRYFVEIVQTRLEEDKSELVELRERVQLQEQQLNEMDRGLREQREELRRGSEGELMKLRECIQKMEDGLRMELAAVSRETAEVRTALDEENQEELYQKIEVLCQRSDEMQTCMEEYAARQNEMYRELRRKLELLDRQSDAFSASVAKAILEYKIDSKIPLGKSTAQTTDITANKPDGDVYTQIDYFKFQNDFRGTRALIAERQSMYLPYFQECKEPVLDIGCGRGEFLRILKEQNIPSFGIDMYPEYVVEGELHGLDVRQGDGIAFLKNADMCFGGIFAAQLIEHISFAQLQDLCFFAYEKLVSGGYLILETPNPTCLAMFTSNFYIDPTHVKPVHPLLLAYILREAGFSEVQTIYTDASHAGKPLPLINSDEIRNLEEVNHAIEQVSNLLYGSLDYAVIAKK